MARQTQESAPASPCSACQLRRFPHAAREHLSPSALSVSPRPILYCARPSRPFHRLHPGGRRPARPYIPIDVSHDQGSCLPLRHRRHARRRLALAHLRRLAGGPRATRHGPLHPPAVPAGEEGRHDGEKPATPWSGTRRRCARHEKTWLKGVGLLIYRVTFRRGFPHRFSALDSTFRSSTARRSSTHAPPYASTASGRWPSLARTPGVPGPVAAPGFDAGLTRSAAANLRLLAASPHVSPLSHERQPGRDAPRGGPAPPCLAASPPCRGLRRLD